MSTDTGLIQGGKMSPLLFSKVMDQAILNWNTKTSKIVVFVDDIILLIRKGYRAQVEFELKRKLANIGLEVNPTKTETVDGSAYIKYLGIALNSKGLSREQQIFQNLEKAHEKERNLIRAGIFKSSGIKL
eukprot:NODE_236_length_11993_cov_1.471078.p8 type:complete len:130 gc:universal NODE_236_length_11993_cov_1.471078:3986-3597(-)